MPTTKTFYEFFAGGGMVSAALKDNWQCKFANDFDQKKAETYKKNWIEHHNVLKVGDVRDVTPVDLPNEADLVWASFPCQDLSLAGGGAGLKGDRSGTFWPFIDLIRKLRANGRLPKIIALENVCGTLTSHQGKDFVAICDALDSVGYQYGAMVVDAAKFLPQSRPRLFFIGIRSDLHLPGDVSMHAPSAEWVNPSLFRAFSQLSSAQSAKWIWWDMPLPAHRNIQLIDLLEEFPKDVAWHDRGQTRTLVDMMSDVNIEKLNMVMESGVKSVGTLYRRTRYTKGEKIQRAEVRFDNLAGCLRTPSGGSSRQFVMLVNGKSVRSRLISARETARLMGLPDEYILPEKYNEAYHLTGDGVVVPVVRHIAKTIIEPIIDFNIAAIGKAA